MYYTEDKPHKFQVVNCELAKRFLEDEEKAKLVSRHEQNLQTIRVIEG